MSEQTPHVAIIDFGMGNLYSVKRACEQVGLNAAVTQNRNDILNADGLILPGVGAFGEAIDYLKKMDLIAPIKDFIQSGKPFFGVCLGMQLLMSESEEFGKYKGLDIIPGYVKRLDPEHQSGALSKVPHVGWNQILLPSKESKTIWQKKPLKNLNSGEYMYFVHSYSVAPEDSNVVLSNTIYEGIHFCSSLFVKNIFAVQYHPEKSADKGIEIYKNWSLIVHESSRSVKCP